MLKITSFQNPKIKYINQLNSKSRFRKKEDTFVIEGVREITLALAGEYHIKEIYFCSDILAFEKLETIIEQCNNHLRIFEVSKDVYEKSTFRSTTEGVIALANAKKLCIENLNIKSRAPLILVADAIEKPGNIGALLRTADAANLDAVLITNPGTDIYNPNIIRSSIGCLFTIPIAIATPQEANQFLKTKKINSYGTDLNSAERYDRIDFTKPSAIIMGTEATGLDNSWLQHTDQNIKIPMSGCIDSMNVSVAAGILIFEAKRQRDFIKIN